MKKTLAALVVAVAMLSLTGSALAATAGQRNAVSSAQDYLDYQAFSKSGLIKQLKFEHFSGSDARYAVNTSASTGTRRRSSRPRTTSTTSRSRARA